MMVAGLSSFWETACSFWMGYPQVGQCVGDVVKDCPQIGHFMVGFSVSEGESVGMIPKIGTG